MLGAEKEVGGDVWGAMEAGGCGWCRWCRYGEGGGEARTTREEEEGARSREGRAT